MGFSNSKLSPKDLTELRKSTEYTTDELKTWYKDFVKDMSNKDGFITHDKYMSLYKQYYPNGDASTFAENTFRVFDSNGDGQIDFREFVVALSVSCRGSDEEKLKWLFQVYDIDNNGEVSKEELLVVMKSLHKMTNDKYDGTQAAIKAEKQMDEIYKRADRDGDGTLSMEEFFALAMSDPSLHKIFMHTNLKKEN